MSAMFLRFVLTAGLSVSIKAVAVSQPEQTQEEPLRKAQAVLPKYKITEKRIQCTDHDSLRRAFFGDLHVHTTLSLDAKVQDTRTTPADAYRFAKGERLGMQPYNANNKPSVYAQISRPLDFVAVTDHAETLGENLICSTPGMQGYDSWPCLGYRWFPNIVGLFFSMKATDGERLAGLCGDKGGICLQASRGPWKEIQQAAEAAYDRSEDCAFTSFVGYEWTGGIFPESLLVANIHGNVIFRNAVVPALPTSYVEANNALALWRRLDDQCLGNDSGCDVGLVG